MNLVFPLLKISEFSLTLWLQKVSINLKFKHEEWLSLQKLEDWIHQFKSTDNKIKFDKKYKDEKHIFL